MTHRTKPAVRSFAREHLCFHKSSPELLFTSELHCSWVCALKIEGNETQHFLHSKLKVSSAFPFFNHVDNVIHLLLTEN